MLSDTVRATYRAVCLWTFISWWLNVIRGYCCHKIHTRIEDASKDVYLGVERWSIFLLLSTLAHSMFASWPQSLGFKCIVSLLYVCLCVNEEPLGLHVSCCHIAGCVRCSYWMAVIYKGEVTDLLPVTWEHVIVFCHHCCFIWVPRDVQHIATKFRCIVAF